MTSFDEAWRTHYGDAPPLSFVLRTNAGARWIRFHALPKSKRYAETPEETAIVLQRANALGAAILSGSTSCWLVQTVAIDDAAPFAAEPGLHAHHTFEYDEARWSVFAGQMDFEAGAFDPLLERIADERAPRTLWFDAQNGRVFAPYDGGFDIFLESDAALTDLKQRFHWWRSPREDGL